MHFPPVFGGEVCEGLISILKEYGVKRVYYGHIHGNYTIPAKIDYDGIELNLIAADYLAFVPKIVN